MARTQRIFTERLPVVVAPYARRTRRLDEWVTAVAFATSGEGGAWLLRRSGIAVSRDTLQERDGDASSTGLTPRQAVGLLLAHDRTAEEGATIESLKAPPPDLAGAVGTLKQPLQVIRAAPHEKPEAVLDAWLAEVAQSGSAEIRAFVEKLH